MDELKANILYVMFRVFKNENNAVFSFLIFWVRRMMKIAFLKIIIGSFMTMFNVDWQRWISSTYRKGEAVFKKSYAVCILSFLNRALRHSMQTSNFNSFSLCMKIF